MNKAIKKIKKLIFGGPNKKYLSNSKKYWESRYSSNGNSGPGSYGKLSIFKANVVNDFVTERNIKTVLDLGCGDGNQLKLANYPNYIGVDVSNKAIELCKKMYSEDNCKSFYTYEEFLKKNIVSELVLSMDVIFHLVEDKVFDDYMNILFSSTAKYVIIYSNNYEKYIHKHVRCRKFTNWIDENLKGRFQQIQFIPNLYPYDEKKPNDTSFSDFFIYEKI